VQLNLEITVGKRGDEYDYKTGWTWTWIQKMRSMPTAEDIRIDIWGALKRNFPDILIILGQIFIFRYSLEF
jgi:hypothetical protein